MPKPLPRIFWIDIFARNVTFLLNKRHTFVIIKHNKMKQKIIVVASFLILATVSVACIIAGINNNEKGVKETRTVESFSGIDADSGFNVYLYQDGKSEVVVESDSTLIQHIETNVKNGVLKIRLKKNVVRTKTLNVHVHFDKLNMIKASGGGDIIGKTILKQNKLVINSSGGSDVSIEVYANEIEANMSGGVDLDISGTTNSFNINASGGSDVNAFDLKSANAKVNASGGCDVEIFATQKIDIDASGASDVVFSGNPKLVNINKSGASDVKRKKND
jgi:hypothetical protein